MATPTPNRSPMAPIAQTKEVNGTGTGTGTGADTSMTKEPTLDVVHSMDGQSSRR